MTDWSERETEERYEALFPDWERERDKVVCPRVVAGKRCRRYAGTGPFGSGRSCVCEKHDGTGPLDHGWVWRTPDGDRVLTGEPYGLSGDRMAAFITDCRELGLQVDVDARSPWNPTGTLLLIVRQEETT